MSKKLSKTNAMRILDSAGIAYGVHEYPENGPVAAVDVAAYLGQPADRLFKTLVTTGGNRDYYVFCLPGSAELDLKKAARAAGVKKIEMLKQKDLFPLTGYVHGGCSPVGMKKAFPTVMHTTAGNWDTVYVSGGRIGLQIEIHPQDLEGILTFRFDDIIRQENEE